TKRLVEARNYDQECYEKDGSSQGIHGWFVNRYLQELQEQSKLTTEVNPWSGFLDSELAPIES
ncbi:MAG: hypothetical protein KDD62_00065, partial [Bdellovibrionales bacterium]|nr:hypothetical protein [Bdellovibrionales bacterium]